MTRRGQRSPQQHPQRQYAPKPTLAAQEARMFRREHEAQAGWCQPMPGSAWHYFPVGEVLSLCGRWLFSGAPREDGNDERADTCVVCHRQVMHRRQREGGMTA